MEDIRLNKIRILVVDNKTFLLNLAVELLKHIGCEDVTTAESGKQALDKMDQAR